MSDELGTLRATMQELLPVLTPRESRDTRIETAPGGVPFICMDDDGHGEFTRACTDREADILIRHGYARDAR